MKKTIAIILLFNILALCIFIQPAIALGKFEKDFFGLYELGYKLDSVDRHDGIKCIWVIYDVAGGKMLKFIPAIHTKKVFYIFKSEDVTGYFIRETVGIDSQERWMTEKEFYLELLKVRMYFYNLRVYKFGESI